VTKLTKTPQEGRQPLQEGRETSISLSYPKGSIQGRRRNPLKREKKRRKEREERKEKEKKVTSSAKIIWLVRKDFNLTRLST
jgi:hypothetical protein